MRAGRRDHIAISISSADEVGNATGLPLFPVRFFAGKPVTAIGYVFSSVLCPGREERQSYDKVHLHQCGKGKVLRDRRGVPGVLQRGRR